MADEISAGGGDCHAVAFDAEEDPQVQLGAHLQGVTHCYYFASSPIFGALKPRFDRAKSDRFCRLYVDGFERLCFALQSLWPNGRPAWRSMRWRRRRGRSSRRRSLAFFGA